MNTPTLEYVLENTPKVYNPVYEITVQTYLIQAKEDARKWREYMNDQGWAMDEDHWALTRWWNDQLATRLSNLQGRLTMLEQLKPK
jgi:hypothetical protein